MELKLVGSCSLYRRPAVLIVPFMELKHKFYKINIGTILSLNRTFYGIETFLVYQFAQPFHVLIVPFMELKHL